MKKIPFRNTIMTVWVLLAVASCGSDGGGSVAGGGTGGTGISSGTVTGFGSVFVNGVEFSTTTSSVTVNGTAGPDESTDPHRGLKVGMVVKVDGEFDDNGTTGTATRITYKSNFEGPVGSISAGATTRQAVVLGQTVILDVNQTHFENATFDTLAVGNVIEVSGLLDNTGRIRATFVKKKADSYNPGTEIEVEGTIQNLNSGAMTFQINALTVDYSLATELPSGGLANDQFVEVNGTSSDNGVTLTATEVEIEDAHAWRYGYRQGRDGGFCHRQNIAKPSSRSELRRCGPPRRRSLRMGLPITSSRAARWKWKAPWPAGC